MDILDLDPSIFPRDDFGPPLGGIPIGEYEHWVKKMALQFKHQIENNPPPQSDGEPFIWRDKD